MTVTKGQIARDLVTGRYVRVAGVRRSTGAGLGSYPAGVLVASVVFGDGEMSIRAVGSLEALTLEEQTNAAIESGLELPTKNQP